jgi:1-deoxy-D-xylulose-5-phosphate reductoisomerase
MGPKITIDSATLMNKGLEVIEAHHLFGVGYDDIRIVVHPQSCVHSMVEYADGSVKAHLGATDMRIPIQYAFSHPRRWDAPLPPVDFTTLGSLEFGAPDLATFRCLGLALEAGRAGGTLPAAMNAANEVAVAAFLSDRCAFTGIDRIVETVMERHARQDVVSLEQLEEVDREARRVADSLI